MTSIKELHSEAMNAVDEAFFARKAGNEDRAKELVNKAFRLESKAAKIIENDYSLEPTRSVLFRSAASLAYECGEYRESEKLISQALIGNPPQEIIEELRDLLEQVNFSRHLRLKNISIEKDEMQLSLSGGDIGLGWAPSELFIGRIKDFERVIFRTIERLANKPFREHGSTSKDIQDGFSLFLVAPRAGSFAVTLRLGRQLAFPEMDQTKEIIDEIMHCFRLLSEGKEKDIKERINSDSYYHNFMALAKRIAPDGEKIKQVGLTVQRDGIEKSISLQRTKKEIQTISPKETDVSISETFVKVEGRLLFADGTREEGEIQLVNKNNEHFTIVVPEGMMTDIVRPLWDNEVIVSGNKKRNKITLVDIESKEF